MGLESFPSTWIHQTFEMRLELTSLLMLAITVAVCNSEPEPKAQYYGRPYYYGGGEAIAPRVAAYVRDPNVALQNPSPIQDPRFFGFTSLISPLFTVTYSTTTTTSTSTTTTTSSCTTSAAALQDCTTTAAAAGSRRRDAFLRRAFADLDDEHWFLKPSPVESTEEKSQAHTLDSIRESRQTDEPSGVFYSLDNGDTTGDKLSGSVPPRSFISYVVSTSTVTATATATQTKSLTAICNSTTGFGTCV